LLWDDKDNASNFSTKEKTRYFLILFFYPKTSCRKHESVSICPFKKLIAVKRVQRYKLIRFMQEFSQRNPNNILK